MQKHYIGETGSNILADCGVLIGSATNQYIKYLKPDGVTIGSWSGSVYSSYSELAKLVGSYFVKHTLVITDLDISGLWLCQAFVAAVDGTWCGETFKLNVCAAFE